MKPTSNGHQTQDFSQAEAAFFGLLAEDPKIIPYRPAFADATGSVISAILLQQMFYRWHHNGQQPFYKYKEPCDATDYREGDSWCEELRFTRREFDAALGAIGQKITNKTKRDPQVFVWYWTTLDRHTYYEVNQTLLRKVLMRLYEEYGSADTCRRKRTLEEAENTRQRIQDKENPEKVTSVRSGPKQPSPLQTRVSDQEVTGFTLADWEDLNAIERVTCALDAYCERYVQRYGKAHPPLKRSQTMRCIAVLQDAFDLMEVDTAEKVAELLDAYFERSLDKTDGNVNAFASPEVLHYLALRLCWPVDPERLYADA